MVASLLFAGRIAVSFLMLFVSSFCHYVLSTTIAKKPWNTRIMLCQTISLIVEMFLNKSVLYNQGVVLSIAMLAIFSYWLYGMRGMKWLSFTIFCLLVLLGIELGCTAMLWVLGKMFQEQEIAFYVMSLDDMFNLRKIVPTTLSTVFVTTIIVLLIRLIQKIAVLLSGSSREARGKRRLVLVYIRILLLLGLWAIMLIQTTDFYTQAVLSGNFTQESVPYVRITITACLLLIVSISYLLQDRRYLQQLSRNETLEQQQIINASLLTSLRAFRHNMVNMLYGFEGAILSGDTGNIKSYYHEMTEKCALVNNENIVALERVVNSSVNALLLQAVERARQECLPINLYVHSGLRFSHALSDSDLCEVIGVLLDNALEAATCAEVRYVSVEMRNLEDTMEIIIKNTYAGEVTEAQLQGKTISTKPGHSGCGLRSVREILARNSKAFLNMWVSGQYVFAQLIILM